MVKFELGFGRFKDDPSKIVRILSTTNEGDFVDIIYSNGDRESVEAFKIEPTTQEDIDNYKLEEDHSPNFLNL